MIDKVAGGHVFGWTWNPATPSSPSPYSVIINGRMQTTGIADQFRQDLESAGVGDGRHAFSIDLTCHLQQEQPFLLHIVNNETGQTPHRSPCLIAKNMHQEWDMFLSPIVNEETLRNSPSVPVLNSAEDQKKFYAKNGFLVFDSGIPEATLNQARCAIDKEYLDQNITLEGRTLDAWRRHAPLHEMAAHPVVLNTLDALYSKPAKPFQTLNFKYGTEQRIHSDTIHFNSHPAGDMCGVWIALEDISAQAGPLVYYPGSHTLPEVTMQDVGVPPSKDYYADYESHIWMNVCRDNMQPYFGIIRKGQALVWAANLLHGGTTRNDSRLTRYSQVTHYFFGDGEYYRPLYSTPDSPKYFQPEWIPSSGCGSS